MSLRTAVLISVLLPSLMLGGQAGAVSVIGSAGGSFASLSSCDSSGGSRDCRLVSTSNGANTQVQWGSQSSSSDFVNPSKLTSVDVAIHAQTNAPGITIGRLDWFNSPTIRANSSLDMFGINWNLALKFTSPSGPDSSGTEVFNLAVTNPINPVGDSIAGLGLNDLSGLAGSFSLSGVTVSNLRFLAVDGAGAGSTSFINNVWYNDESNHASLYLLADFSHGQVLSAVPESGTWTMMLSGLALLGFTTRRRGQVRQQAGRAGAQEALGDCLH